MGRGTTGAARSNRQSSECESCEQGDPTEKLKHSPLLTKMAGAWGSRERGASGMGRRRMGGGAQEEPENEKRWTMKDNKKKKRRMRARTPGMAVTRIRHADDEEDLATMRWPKPGVH